MIKSPYELDQRLGLDYYLTDHPGTGGTLRREPEDFRVEENANHPEGTGKYLLCRLIKKNWDQQRAVKEIANRLGISHQRITFAGTKDKRAVTTQYISVFQGDPDRIRQLHVPDMSIEPLYLIDQPLHLGSLTGNRFHITIRDADTSFLRTDPDSYPAVFENGIPNYYGYQRFGVKRPVTHIIGLSLLKGDFEQAVMDIVGMCGDETEPMEEEGRTCYRNSGDAKEALHLLPVRLSLERSLLHYLIEHPEDYHGAILSLPRTLRSMYVSAVQSWFFNRTLSRRLSDNRSLFIPEPGDRLLYPDGKHDIVTERTIKPATMQITRGRCEIAILMPGSDLKPGNGPDDRCMKELFDEQEISPEMFGTIGSFLQMQFAGALRAVAMKTTVEITMSGDDPILSFGLNPGQYATTILREIMKADPRKMA